MMALKKAYERLAKSSRSGYVWMDDLFLMIGGSTNVFEIILKMEREGKAILMPGRAQSYHSSYTYKGRRFTKVKIQ